MADRGKILGKESVAFANKDRPKTHRGRANTSQVTTTSVKRPEMDELLENTLINSIETGKPLTRREAEILPLIVSGKTNKEIARRLCRTERTVEYHRNRLMRKVGAHNAADLVNRAIAMGIT